MLLLLPFPSSTCNVSSLPSRLEWRCFCCLSWSSISGIPIITMRCLKIEYFSRAIWRWTMLHAREKNYCSKISWWASIVLRYCQIQHNHVDTLRLPPKYLHACNDKIRLKHENNQVLGSMLKAIVDLDSADIPRKKPLRVNRVVPPITYKVVPTVCTVLYILKFHSNHCWIAPK